IGLLQDGIYQLKVWNGAGIATSLPATLSFLGPLQNLMNNAAAGSTIVLPPGIYAERLVITKHLTLSGAGPGITTLDALSHGTAVTIGNGANVALEGLTIRNGRSPANGMGGGIRNLGHLQLLNCQLASNSADWGGGLFNAGNFCATNTTLVANHAVGAFNMGPGIGGGIYSAGGTGWVVNCTISANTAPEPGAVA